MTTGKKPKKRPLIYIGSILIAVSYFLWVPTCLFVTLTFTGNAWLWCRLATASYIISWVLLIIGFLLIGPDAARSSRRLFTKLFSQITTRCTKTDTSISSEGEFRDVQ